MELTVAEWLRDRMTGQVCFQLYPFNAKAYRNALPTAKRGIEFTTPARPCPGNGTPYEARWYYPKNPSVRRNSLGYAVIDISVRLNRQVS
jgi:hypothetical protein